MSPKDSSILANRLRVSREQSGLSQGQVAKLLKMHRPTISEIEAGRRKVSVEEVSRFSEIYDVSVSWLVDGKSEIPDPKFELAAREISRLKQKDLDVVLELLQSLRASRAQSE